MSLDWHPQHTSLMAVGCYDGSVKVYDMRVRRTTPLYTSIPGNGQHRSKRLLSWSACRRQTAVAMICDYVQMLSASPHKPSPCLWPCLGTFESQPVQSNPSMNDITLMPWSLWHLA